MMKTIDKMERIHNLKLELQQLENDLERDVSETENICRMEDIRGISIPICGHDILTEFMIDDLEKKNINAIYFYGGLMAKKDQSNFHWYISTIRIREEAALKKFQPGLEEMASFFAFLSQESSLNLLNRLYLGPLNIQKMTDGEREIVNELSKIKLVFHKNNHFLLSDKGVQVIVLFSHLANNLLVKPESDQLNEILSEFERQFGRSKFEGIGHSLKQLTEILEQHSSFENLEQKGIERHIVENMLKMYYGEPF